MFEYLFSKVQNLSKVHIFNIEVLFKEGEEGQLQQFLVRATFEFSSFDIYVF